MRPIYDALGTLLGQELFERYYERDLSRYRRLLLPEAAIWTIVLFCLMRHRIRPLSR